MNTFFIGMHFLPWRLLASFAACSPTVARAAHGAQPHHALQCRPCRARAATTRGFWCDTACRHRFAWVQTHWIFINFLMEIYKSITNLKSHPIHDANGIRDTSGEQIYIYCILLLYIMWGTFFLNMNFLRYSVPTQENWGNKLTNSVKNFEYRLNLDNYSNISFILLFY